MTVDPALAAICKAVYGDTVDPLELAKAVDASDVHTDKPMGVEKPTKKKLLAAGLLAGAAAEAIAAKDTVPDLLAGIKHVKPAFRAATGAHAKMKALKPLAIGGRGKVLPATLGPAAKTAIQGANFTVGLGAAKELMPKKKQPMNKALRIRLRPLNPQDVRRIPSLKTRRPGLAVQKSLTAVGEISKMDEDQHLVFGWANVSEIDGEPVIDRQGDIISIDELEKAAYDYVLDCRVGGDQHARIGKSDDLGPRHTSTVVESMVFTPEKIEKLGLPPDFPQGWWVGMKVHDEDSWQLIKSGRRTGFSVHGTGKRDAVFGMSKGLLRRAADRKLTGPVGRSDKRNTKYAAAGVAGAAGGNVAAQYVPKTARTIRHAMSDTKKDDARAALVAMKVSPVAENARAARKALRHIHAGEAVGATATVGAYAAYRHHKQKVAKGEKLKELKRRTNAAAHPPAVKLRPVSSSAVQAMGYQPQTRRLAYAMRSRPDAPYNYKASPKQAKEAEGAESIGRHYATQVRGKYKRKDKVTLVDRGRLFVNPPQGVNKSVEDRRRRAHQVELGGQVTAGTVGLGFGAAKLRDAFKEEHPEKFKRATARAGKKLVEHGVPRAKAARLMRLARTGKPGFKPFVAAATAGAVATGAHRYQELSGLHQKHRATRLPLSTGM